MDRTPHFDVAIAEEGHIKVRLFFNTWEPRHTRSHFLKQEASAAPPFTEDVSVLVPVQQVFNRVSAFRSIFLALQAQGLLAAQDTLKAFELREEDTHTLAYIDREYTPC